MSTPTSEVLDSRRVAATDSPALAEPTRESSSVHRIPGREVRYGGDYNPEQWSRDVWIEDIELMRRAGVNLVSVGIFSWVLLEPREGEYDFTFLDDLIGLLAEAGIDVDLGTPTAAPPAWFWKKYPEAHPVTRDGIRLGFGSRGMVSPSSPEYRRAATGITEQLARRYASNPAVVMWHIHNEYGAPISDSYDDYSVAAFREWARARYTTLDALNAAWGTLFWGQRYGDWDEIDAPRLSASVSNQAQRLDYQRFTSDALLACYVAERDVIRRYTQTTPITTNFMATNCPSVDYWSWAREVDVVANDHYLVAERRDNHVMLAMDADLTRSLAGGRPWILMEHSTSAVNWQPRNIAKRPGELARNSLSHFARGADAIMFFQFRASRFGAEKFHSAMLPHAGTGTRIWREVEELGSALGALGPVRGSRVEASVAVVWSIESFWALDLEWRPSVELGHRERVEAFYTALWNRGVTIDFVLPEHDLSGYDVVFAPSLYLLGDEGAASLDRYVAGGGTLVVSYFSGIVGANDEVAAGASPGALRDVLGLEIHEFLPLHEGETVDLGDGRRGAAWSEEIVLTGAESEALYATGPAAGGPAITRNARGDGTAWYVSTKLTGDDLQSFVDGVLARAGVAHAAPPAGLESVERVDGERRFAFHINHADEPAVVAAHGTDLLTGDHVDGEITVPGAGYRIIASPR
ncbi:beta-galactosidase [Agromyces atrinae]|uniref:Beta-galactosidase n=1 Tax=Agromyces atrinae TaxID=592376 RepID=A0A4Q2MDP8_9MICO|nr:beta-galactosidase [Agromyces atrinae]NYD67599.1 beta-galactosidase [Agromyces atrinae]RXZ88192.1 beta-galactosidase [Agromyces atrinae]